MDSAMVSDRDEVARFVGDLLASPACADEFKADFTPPVRYRRVRHGRSAIASIIIATGALAASSAWLVQYEISPIGGHQQIVVAALVDEIAAHTGESRREVALSAAEAAHCPNGAFSVSQWYYQSVLEELAAQLRQSRVRLHSGSKGPDAT